VGRFVRSSRAGRSHAVALRRSSGADRRDRRRGPAPRAALLCMAVWRRCAHHVGRVGFDAQQRCATLLFWVEPIRLRFHTPARGGDPAARAGRSVGRLAQRCGRVSLRRGAGAPGAPFRGRRVAAGMALGGRGGSLSVGRTEPSHGSV
jgi:hypothetical protein